MERISAKEIPGSVVLGEFTDSCWVYQVDGDYVRDRFDVEWIGGGHSHVNDFIAEGEIWVERGISEDDNEARFVHETIEYVLMCYAKWDYEKAHDYSNSVEAVFRGNEQMMNRTEEEEVETPEQHANEVKLGLETGPYKDNSMEDVNEPEGEGKMGYGKSGPKTMVMIMLSKKKKGMGKFSPSHPGFSAVQNKIEGEGYSKEAAGAILANASRHASPSAKAVNPRLSKIPGMGKAAMPHPGKIEITMHEFKEGNLHSGSAKGPKVTNRKQAIAIALSQARKKGN